MTGRLKIPQLSQGGRWGAGIIIPFELGVAVRETVEKARNGWGVCGNHEDKHDLYHPSGLSSEGT